jgi:hypothetical protein
MQVPIRRIPQTPVCSRRCENKELCLDELRKLKNERESLKAQISQTKSLSYTVPDAEIVANRIDNN